MVSLSRREGRSAFCCLMAALFALALPADADTWPQIKPLPGDGQAQWVAQNMVQNGVPMRIQAFSSNLTSDEVLAFYRREWSSLDENQPVENRHDGWIILGQRSGDYYLTVQARKGRTTTSEGFLAVSRPFSPIDVEDQRALAAFPQLPDTQTVSKTSANDGAKHSTTLILQNRHSTESNANFYQSTLSRQGWALQQNFDGAGHGAAGRVMFFNRPGETIQLAIVTQSSGETIIAATQVDIRGEGAGP